MTVGDLQTVTNMPIQTIKTAVKQLAAGGIFQIPEELDDASVVTLIESPSLPAVVDLIPPVSFTIHTHTTAAPQDMSIIHRLKIDAAIVRILKKEKFVKYEDLAGKLATIIDFVPDVREFDLFNLKDSIIKERVDLLISKDYISRNEQDESILDYQASIVC